jgi:hypothetical protein
VGPVVDRGLPKTGKPPGSPIETAMRDHTTASRSSPLSRLPPRVGVSRAVGHPGVMQSFDCVDAPCLLVTYAASARPCGAVPPWPELLGSGCLKTRTAREEPEEGHVPQVCLEVWTEQATTTERKRKPCI